MYCLVYYLNYWMSAFRKDKVLMSSLLLKFQLDCVLDR